MSATDRFRRYVEHRLIQMIFLRRWGVTIPPGIYLIRRADGVYLLLAGFGSGVWAA